MRAGSVAPPCAPFHIAVCALTLAPSRSCGMASKMRDCVCVHMSAHHNMTTHACCMHMLGLSDAQASCVLEVCACRRMQQKWPSMSTCSYACTCTCTRMYMCMQVHTCACRLTQQKWRRRRTLALTLILTRIQAHAAEVASYRHALAEAQQV